MANYPTSAPNLDEDFDQNMTLSSQAHTTEGHEKPNQEINAIATELGLSPKAAALETRASTATAVVNLLGQFKQGIKDMLGTSNWYDAVPTTLTALFNKFPLQHADIDTDAVETTNIKDGAVTLAKIPDATITGVKLNVDSAAEAITTPFVTAPPQLATGSQETGAAAGGGYVNSIGGDITFYTPFKTKMTNAPSAVTLSAISYSNCGTLVFFDATVYGFRCKVTASSTDVVWSVSFSYVTVGN